MKFGHVETSKSEENVVAVFHIPNQSTCVQNDEEANNFEVGKTLCDVLESVKMIEVPKLDSKQEVDDSEALESRDYVEDLTMVMIPAHSYLSF